MEAPGDEEPLLDATLEDEAPLAPDEEAPPGSEKKAVRDSKTVLQRLALSELFESA